MSNSFQNVLDHARSLDLSDRVRLVQAIWDDLAASGQTFELSQELREELDRRIERHAAHPEEASTWTEVRSRIEGSR